MPPKIRYDREAVLQAAYRIARTQGAEAVNARAVARELGCSTQPIFRAFSGMEEVHRELLRLARACYNGYMARSAALADRPYKGTGMAYILFARDEPQLFRMLFMRDRLREGGALGSDDDNLEYVIQLICQTTGLDRDTAMAFHLELWVFTHGLAVLVATRYLPYNEGEISRMLSDQYEAMLALYRQRLENAP